MSKIGRNDPCPCGSARKYKVCCLEKDRAAEQAVFAAAAAARAREEATAAEQRVIRLQQTRDFLEHRVALLEQHEEFTAASNAPLELIDAGKLDEAEAAARDLLARFPEVHDGYDRLGMVYEARGERKQAADCYRKVLEFVQAHPDDYDPGFATTFRELIDKLDPTPTPTPAT